MTESKWNPAAWNSKLVILGICGVEGLEIMARHRTWNEGLEFLGSSSWASSGFRNLGSLARLTYGLGDVRHVLGA